MFEQRDMQKQTRISNDGTRYQINDVVEDLRHANNVTDVRTLRQPGGGKVHIVVRAKFKFWLSCQKNSGKKSQTQWVIIKLNDCSSVKENR